ncbi:MAG: hypothetical protein JXA21_27415 [Anaerolineae bacterium]|nr:hypothetical protein [Anaerolineae bacterium]
MGFDFADIQKMYVKGSLVNRGDGFVFQIKNLLDSGNISGVLKLTVDGVEQSLDGVTVELSGKARPARDLMWSAPLYVQYGAVLTIYVPGALEPGQHTISFTVNARDIGSLSMPFTDDLS